MIKGKRVCCVIPARLASVRFPRKMLALIKGKSLLQWAFEAACRVPYFDQIVIATDALEIVALAKQFGAEALLTSLDCQNGTERLIELQRRREIKAEVWVNWQGDGPLISKEMIASLLQSCHVEEEEIWTLKKRIHTEEEIYSPHVVKVVCNHRGQALYFSRTPIPYFRDQSVEKKYYKHVGLYAFTEKALEKMASLLPCSIEEAEKLEQLRFLYHGFSITVHETVEESIEVDTEEQISLIAQLL